MLLNRATEGSRREFESLALPHLDGLYAARSASEKCDESRKRVTSGGRAFRDDDFAVANLYVQDDSLAGQTVTFNGLGLANSLVSPYACTIFLSSSASSVNGSLYFSANRAWDFAESILTPSTTAPRFLNAANSSRKPQASFVQPGVSSLG